LVGIKDTNEQLVSATLRALADLIPVLGATAVIGGKRAKLFTDGRPKVSILIICHNPYLIISSHWKLSSIFPESVALLIPAK
jgi:hypothetical protein